MSNPPIKPQHIIAGQLIVGDYAYVKGHYVRIIERIRNGAYVLLTYRTKIGTGQTRKHVASPVWVRRID